MKISHDKQPAPPQPRSGMPQDASPQQDAGQAQDTGQARYPEYPAGAGEHAQPGYGESAEAGFLRAVRPWTTLYAAGAATVILGLLVLIWPKATLVVLALLFGCYLVVSGVFSMIEGITARDSTGGMRAAYIVIGVLGVVLGLFSLRRIDVTVLVLAFLLSAFWIMRGIIDLAAATSRREPHSGLRAMTGVLSLIAGVVILFWPGITLTVLLVIAGIWLIVYGVSMLLLGRQLHKLAG